MRQAMALPKKAPRRRQLPKTPPPERQLVGVEKIDGAAVVYQLEHVRCGKQSCKSCAASGGHGPYWYAYWTTFGRTRSLYIGKELRSVAETLDRRAARREASNG